MFVESNEARGQRKRRKNLSCGANPRSGRQGRGETLKRVEVLPVSLREIDRGPQES